MTATEQMITLSLVRDIAEIKALRVRRLPFNSNDVKSHDQKEWITEQFMKWSKAFAFSNEHLDQAIVSWGCVLFGTCPEKERVFTAIKALDITGYLELFLSLARKERSSDKAISVYEKLHGVIENGQCDTDFDLGVRVVGGYEEFKRTMPSEQWSEWSLILKECLTHSLDFHCNYWMKSKFIDLDQYVHNRSHQILWSGINAYILEYTFEYPIPAHIRSNRLLNAFVDKSCELCVAVDDYYTAVCKVLSNVITSRVLSMAHHYKWSLQKAIDSQYEYCLQLNSECQKLMDQLMALTEAEDTSMRQYLMAVRNSSNAISTFMFQFEGLYVRADGMIWSYKWDKLYDDMVNNKPNNVHFDT